MSRIVKVNEAKTHLSQLLSQLEKGEEDEIIIMRGSKPVGRFLPYHEKKSAFGLLQGRIKVEGDCWMTTDEDWEGYA